MNQIEHIMKCLNCSKEEALQVIKDDERINRGEKLFELSLEQKKAETAIKRTQGILTIPRKRTQNPNLMKQAIINKLEETLLTVATNVQIEHKERIITFTLDNTKYKLTLSVPRENG